MATDLSDRHGPVSDLFPGMDSPDVYERYALTDEQVKTYHERGYVAGMRLLDEQQIEALRAELADVMRPDHDGVELWHEFFANESGDDQNVLFHALGAWRLREALHDVLWNPAFVVPASQLLGGPVRFWHDQLFCKPARHGGVVAWHQDYSYWTRTKPLAHLTCWIGLDDATTENGCLHYVPGSHAWPLLPTTNLAEGMDAIKEVLSPEQREQFVPEPCELRAGEASFHHAMTVHGSYANRSDRPRRGLVINVFRDGVCSDQDEPMLKGSDPIPAGAPMGGRFHPLLFAGQP
ncbi:MAG: phytanoyl-CoA dioxygenase family protein [Planctomycetota bacterium]